VKPVGEGNIYLDRFSQPTGWSSIVVNKQTIFLYETNGNAELFDSNMKPLIFAAGRLAQLSQVG
jgi:hypothetical protein